MPPGAFPVTLARMKQFRSPQRSRRALICAVASVTLLCACSPPEDRASALDTATRVKARGVLVVATNSSWKPQSYIGDDGQLMGFDVDVAKEIGRRLGYPVRFQTPDWALMTGGHWRGRWDMMIGSATPTKARARVVDFAGIYYYSPYVIVVNSRSDYSRVEQLAGKRIGVETGTTSEDYVRRKLEIDDVGAPRVTYILSPGGVHNYASSMLPFDDLRLPNNARIDAVLASEQTALTAVRSGYPVRILPGVEAFREPLTIVTDKGDPAWTTRIRGVVAAMRADGALKAIALKWYGKDYSQ